MVRAYVSTWALNLTLTLKYTTMNTTKYLTMTKAQLSELLKSHNIKLSSKATKEEMINHLLSVEKPAKTGPQFKGEY